MTRKKRDYTRSILPDPKYGDIVVAKMINVMMISGKRSVAEKALYAAIATLQEKTKQEPLECFHKALGNIRPYVEVRSRRVGGATYQVPTEVRPVRRDALAIRWIINNARSRSEKSMKEKLAFEIFEASQNRGNAVKKKEDTHKMAEANRAFAHYRW